MLNTVKRTSFLNILFTWIFLVSLSLEANIVRMMSTENKIIKTQGIITLLANRIHKNHKWRNSSLFNLSISLQSKFQHIENYNNHHINYLSRISDRYEALNRNVNVHRRWNSSKCIVDIPVAFSCQFIYDWDVNFKFILKIKLDN